MDNLYCILLQPFLGIVISLKGNQGSQLNVLSAGCEPNVRLGTFHGLDDHDDAMSFLLGHPDPGNHQKELERTSKLPSEPLPDPFCPLFQAR